MSKLCIVGINNATGEVDFASLTVTKRDRVEAARQSLDVVVVSNEVAKRGLIHGLPTYESLLIEKEINQKVLNWFATGRTGLSSKCLAVTLLNGGPFLSVPNHHPGDPADFERCLNLLHAVPELREKMHIMKIVSKNWSALIDQWSEVETTFKNETGYPARQWNRAPKTFELMQSIYKGLNHA